MDIDLQMCESGRTYALTGEPQSPPVDGELLPGNLGEHGFVQMDIFLINNVKTS